MAFRRFLTNNRKGSYLHTRTSIIVIVSEPKTGEKTEVPKAITLEKVKDKQIVDGAEFKDILIIGSSIIKDVESWKNVPRQK